MKLVVMENGYDISKAVSAEIISQINQKPDSVLGFATGNSPIETYKRIIEAYENGEVSLKNISTFNLDEYCGLDHDNIDGYYYFMKKMLFGQTDVDFSNVNFLDGTAQDYERECARYSEKIDTMGIDIQLLGVGTNGHIGFNEPADEFTHGAFCVKLTESTIKSNIVLFEGRQMPTHALTMGVGDIMKAKKILLIATGASKAKAIKAMFEGPVTPMCPASILQTHPDVTIFADKESIALLSTETING